MDKSKIREYDESLRAITECLSQEMWKYHARLGKAYLYTSEQRKDAVSLGRLAEAQESINKVRALLSEVKELEPETK